MPPRRSPPRATPGALLLSLVSLAACSDASPPSTPLDRLLYPTSLAVVDGRLLVVSSNYDLAWGAGTVLSLDPGAELATIQGGVQIASFGGEIAVADATACGLPATQALVPARAARVLYRLDLDDRGVPSCGPGCEVALDARDPYGVAVTCRAGATARAWVSHVTTTDDIGYVSAVDLATGEARAIAVAEAGVRGLAWDADAERLFFTTYRGADGAAYLGWIGLGGGCTPGDAEWEGGCAVRTIDVTDLVSGIDLAALALSNAQPGLARRVYVAARLYDTDDAEAADGRPSSDIGGLLLVLELGPGADGELRATLVRSVPIGLGVSEVRTLPPRDGRRDLVAVTATDDALLAIYDDEAGAVRAVLSGDDVNGDPLLGDQPFGLAVEAREGGVARAYVVSFEDGFVTPVDVPLDAPWAAAPVRQGAAASAALLRIGAQP